MSAGLKLAEFVSLSHLEILNKGRDYDSTRLTITDVNRPGLQFQGFYDYFDPMRLQVIGKAEVMYLKGLPEEARRKCFDDFFLYDIPALVIARELDCFPECMESAQFHGRTLLRTKETTVDFTSQTIELLNRVMAPCVTRHGVLLDVHGEGVMITGDSGIGKSEVAIELIMRGHRLVADDAVEIKETSRSLGSGPSKMSPSWTWWLTLSSGTTPSSTTAWGLRTISLTFWMFGCPVSLSRCARGGASPVSWRWRP